MAALDAPIHNKCGIQLCSMCAAVSHLLVSSHPPTKMLPWHATGGIEPAAHNPAPKTKATDPTSARRLAI